MSFAYCPLKKGHLSIRFGGYFGTLFDDFDDPGKVKPRVGDLGVLGPISILGRWEFAGWGRSVVNSCGYRILAGQIYKRFISGQGLTIGP